MSEVLSEGASRLAIWMLSWKDVYTSRVSLTTSLATLVANLHAGYVFELVL